MTGHREMVAWFRVHGPRLAAGLAILTVATVTGIVSYSHIHQLTLVLHQPPMVATLMPFGVDGLIVAGSVVLLQGSLLGWAGVGPGAAISLFANVESGIGFGWLAAAWAGVPAVAFALSTFILERWLKGQAATQTPVPGSARKTRVATARAAHPGPDPAPVPPPIPVAEPGNVPVPPSDQRRNPASSSGRAGGQGQDNRTAILNLRAMNPGWTHKEIAAELGIVPRTVSRHLAHVNGSSA